MNISIATWNVNSIRSRLPHLLGWLREYKPDIVLLQELKCTDDAFPSMEIEELGYNMAVYGEKTYNGVAIISKFPLDDISRGLAGDELDTHSRYIEATASVGNGAIRVASVYVPNGQLAPSDKFSYKLRFLDRLQVHIKSLLDYEEIFVIGFVFLSVSCVFRIIAKDINPRRSPTRFAGTVLARDHMPAARPGAPLG